MAEGPGEGDLGGGGVVSGGDGGEGGGVEEGAALADGGVGHEGEFVAGGEGEEVELDAAVLGVVEDLVGGAEVAVGAGVEVFHEADVEVGDAPGADFAGVEELFEGGDGFGEGVIAGPMEEVEVEALDVEAA